jgi:hypothetical protein
MARALGRFPVLGTCKYTAPCSDQRLCNCVCSITPCSCCSPQHHAMPAAGSASASAAYSLAEARKLGADAVKLQVRGLRLVLEF